MVQKTNILTPQEWYQAHEYMFNETNIYRAVLGLPTLAMNLNVSNSSTSFSKYYVSNIVSHNNPLDIRSINKRDNKLREIFANNKHYGLGRNVYCSRTVNLNSGFEAFNTWQLSEYGNKLLKYKDLDFMGLGYEDHTEDGKTGLIYITQQFVRNYCNKQVKQTIDFTPEMCEHLNIYQNLVFYHLNKFINEDIQYTDDMKSWPVQMDPVLNNIATYQLLLTIDNRLHQNYINDSVIDFAKSKFYCMKSITPIILISPTYIPPVRLINSKEGLPEDILELIKNRHLNKFGINVALFDNKTFLISIVFAKIFQ